MSGKTTSQKTKKKHNLTRHGYRTHYQNFSTLKKFVEGLKERPKQDKDSVVLVLGYNGVGKSAFKTGVSLLYDNYYRLEKQMFWNEKGLDFTKKVNEIVKERPEDPYKVIDLDEMKNQFDSQTPFMALDSKVAANEMTENREDNLLIIGATPVLKGITRYMRQDRIKFIVFVYERGKAVVIKNLYTILGGNWHLDILEDTIEKAFKEGRKATKQELLKAFKKMPNSWKINGRLVVVHFPDFPPGFKDEYKSWKYRKRREAKIEDIEKRKKKESGRTKLERRYQLWLQGLVYHLVESKGLSRSKISKIIKKYVGDDAPSKQTITNYYDDMERSVKKRNAKRQDKKPSKKLYKNTSVMKNFRNKEGSS